MDYEPETPACYDSKKNDNVLVFIVLFQKLHFIIKVWNTNLWKNIGNNERRCYHSFPITYQKYGFSFQNSGCLVGS